MPRLNLNFEQYLAIAKDLDIADEDFGREAVALKTIAKDLQAKGQLPGLPDNFEVAYNKNHFSIIDPIQEKRLYKIK